MAQIVKLSENYRTEMPDIQSGQWSDEDAGLSTETTECIPYEEKQRERSVDISTASSSDELLEKETSYISDRALNEELQRNERARANAIMDQRCLEFLQLFNQKGPLTADEINEFVVNTGDWLKIALLMRADYLQNLDSVVRITQDGLSALLQLNKVRELNKSS